MSMQTTTWSDNPAVARRTAAPAVSWLAQRAWQMAATIRLRRAIRRAEADLMALSDRTLKDIGLSRGEIRSVVREVLAANEFAARLSRSARG